MSKSESHRFPWQYVNTNFTTSLDNLADEAKSEKLFQTTNRQTMECYIYDKHKEILGKIQGKIPGSIPDESKRKREIENLAVEQDL